MTEKMKGFSMEIPKVLHTDFKSRCAQGAISMGSVLTKLIEGWMNGGFVIDWGETDGIQ